MVTSPMWWRNWGFSRPATLSILDLLESKTLDFKLAGLLWLLMEARASVLIASRPAFAGKTTLLYSLLDLLPPGISQYSLQGFDEDFSFTERYKPETTYLVSEEISNHQYEYLWGHQAQKTLRLLSQGYHLGTTIHAGNIREVAYLLHGYLKVPLSDIANLGSVITLDATNGRSYQDNPIRRRVLTVTIINKDRENLIARTLAARESSDGGFIYPEEKVLREVLFNKFGIKCVSISTEIASREAFLMELYDTGIRSREDVRRTIANYYQSR